MNPRISLILIALTLCAWPQYGVLASENARSCEKLFHGEKIHALPTPSFVGSAGASLDKNEMAKMWGALEDFWEPIVLGEGLAFYPPKLVLFDSEIDTGCGTTAKLFSPFYCPADAAIYFPEAFSGLLNTFGFTLDAEFMMVILSHEFSHHVQMLLKLNHSFEKLLTNPRAKSWYQLRSFRELHADALSGYFMRSLVDQGDVEYWEAQNAQKLIEFVGDDVLSTASVGFFRLSQEHRHGISKWRGHAYNIGFQTHEFSTLMPTLIQQMYGPQANVATELILERYGFN